MISERRVCNREMDGKQEKMSQKEVLEESTD